MELRIAINLLPFTSKIAGAGKYAQKIVQNLSMLDDTNHYYLFVNFEGKKHFENLGANFEFIVAEYNPVSYFKRILWEQFIFPFKLASHKIDVLFTPSVAVPVMYFGKMYTTIHDIAFKKIKFKYSLLRRLYLSFITLIAIHKSKIIFTVSEFSKKELLKNYRLDNDKVIVTYNAVDNNFNREVTLDDSLKVKQKYALPDKYILYVGAIEPGKNLERLLIVFNRLIKIYPKLFLVMTGGMGWGSIKVLEKNINQKKNNNLIILPFVPEIELPIIFKMSELLVYIPFYEGFGLPVLEGMSVGTPVITSNAESILEFAGSSVKSVDPFNDFEIENAITELLENDDIRSEMITNGKIRAKNFSWLESAKIIHKKIVGN